MFWDHLELIAPDYDHNYILNIAPTAISPLSTKKHIQIQVFDDGSERRIYLGDMGENTMEIEWGFLNLNDYNEIFDLYWNVSKANAQFNSFRWYHPLHRKNYTVRFDDALTDLTITTRYALKTKLKILGSSNA